MPAARVARQAPAEIRVRAVRAEQVALGGPAAQRAKVARVDEAVRLALGVSPVQRAKVARVDKAARLAWVAALGHCLI
jgi:hypothetical protein